MKGKGILFLRSGQSCQVRKFTPSCFAGAAGSTEDQVAPFEGLRARSRNDASGGGKVRLGGNSGENASVGRSACQVVPQSVRHSLGGSHSVTHLLTHSMKL